YNFSVAVWVGYIALFGIVVETGVVMVIYLHEALDRKLAAGFALKRTDIEQAAIESAVQRLRPKLMTVAAVLASLAPILWATGVGSDVMKPIAAPIVGGMITSTINVLLLVPVFFVMMKARAMQEGKLQRLCRRGGGARDARGFCRAAALRGLFFCRGGGGVFGTLAFFSADGRLALNCPKDKAAPLADWLIAQGAAHVCVAAQDYMFLAENPLYEKLAARLPKIQG